MSKPKMVWAIVVAATILALSQHAGAQDSATQSPVKADALSVDQQPADIGRYLDRFLDRATVAADAAGLVTEADEHRREAERMLKAGRRNEARALFRQAGEAIAAAAPDRDAKRDDPFLREYLREVTAALIALEAPSVDSSLSADFGSRTDQNINGNLLTNARVSAFRSYWLGSGRQRLYIGRDRFAVYRPMMARIFREEGVPEWLLAVAFVESTYSTSALSPKQALGIWQFIPETGARYGLQRTAWTDERQNPEKSTRAAARYLRNLYALFGDWPLAIAAYNTGENRVARIMRRTGIRDFWTMASRGLLYPETINYVPSVIAASQLLGASHDVQVGSATRRATALNSSRRASLKISLSESRRVDPLTLIKRIK
ncbi:MAG: lytic transglycosylase domain-containing protein [Acidobacteria bacterium]|nr:lytic transglycosylase domain-containing protein [Acidobacteriota bacterium]